MWNLKKKKIQLIDTENRLMVARNRGWGWRRVVGEMGEGSQKCTLPVIK